MSPESPGRSEGEDRSAAAQTSSGEQAATILWALLAGVLFGAGLIVSGMSDSANVLGFLDVTGAWNPSLAFAMGGAILVAAPAFAWVRRHGRTLQGQPVRLPDRRHITAPLVLGSVLFGLGWGLVGLCPGPAVVVAAQGVPKACAFLIALALGLAVASFSARSRRTVDPRTVVARSCRRPLRRADPKDKKVVKN